MKTILLFLLFTSVTYAQITLVRTDGGEMTLSDTRLYRGGVLIPIAGGGTGNSTLAKFDLLIGNGAGAIDSVGFGTSGYLLAAQGATAKPHWVSQASLTLSTVPAIIQVDSGGTGAASLPKNDLVVGNGTNPVDSVLAGTTGMSLLCNGAAVKPSFGYPTFTPTAYNDSTDTLTVSGKSITEYLITYNAGVGGYRISAPVAGDNGKVLIIASLGAHAHVVTCVTEGFNAKGSTGTLTFGGAIGDTAIILAYNGHWYLISKVNVVAG